MVSDNAIAVKDTVYTPDGKGVVTEMNDRYVSVTLEGGRLCMFPHRDIYRDEKLEQRAIVKPPSPVTPPAPEATNEGDGQSPPPA